MHLFILYSTPTKYHERASYLCTMLTFVFSLDFKFARDEISDPFSLPLYIQKMKYQTFFLCLYTYKRWNIIPCSINFITNNKLENWTYSLYGNVSVPYSNEILFLFFFHRIVFIFLPLFIHRYRVYSFGEGVPWYCSLHFLYLISFIFVPMLIQSQRSYSWLLWNIQFKSSFFLHLIISFMFLPYLIQNFT